MLNREITAILLEYIRDILEQSEIAWRYLLSIQTNDAKNTADNLGAAILRVKKYIHKENNT